MNSKTTWFLAILALFLGAYIAFFETDSTRSEKSGVSEPEKLFPDLDPHKVTSLEITLRDEGAKTNRLVRAARVDGRWFLQLPDYPAEAGGIEALLQEITTLREHSYVSPQELTAQPGGLGPYGLQPPRASVALISGTNRMSFNLGAKALVGETVYLQTIGNPGVFLTDAKIMNYLPKSGTDWRDTALLDSEALVFDRLAVANGTRLLELQQDTNQVWKLTKPLQTQADMNRVQYLVRQLSLTRISEFVSDDARADLESLGLLNPESELTLSRGTNPVAQVQFGRSPAGNPAQVYARRRNQPNIFLVPKETLELLQVPYEEFRDRTLLAFDTNAVQRIEIQAAETFALEKQTNGAWRIVEPYSAPADSILIAYKLFQELARLEIKEFPKDVVTDFSIYGLNPPARQYALKKIVTTAAGKTNELVAQVGFSTNSVQNPDRVFARRASEISAYVVSFGDIQRLPQYAFELRDRRIWNFSSTNVQSVTIAQGGQTRKLTRNAAEEWFSDTVANVALEETLHRLGRLYASSWRSEGDTMLKALFPEESRLQIQLEVSSGGKLHLLTLEIGKQARQGEAYANVVLGDRRLIFMLPASIFEMVAQHLQIAEPEAVQ